MNLNELLPKGVAPVREAVPNYHVAELKNPLAGMTDAVSETARAAVKLYADTAEEEANAELSRALVDAGNEISAARSSLLQTSGLQTSTIVDEFDEKSLAIRGKYADTLKSERARDIFLARISEAQERHREQLAMHRFDEMRKSNIESHEALATQAFNEACSAPVPKAGLADEMSNEEKHAWYSTHFSALFQAEQEIRNVGSLNGDSAVVVEQKIQAMHDKLFAEQVKRFSAVDDFNGAKKVIALYRDGRGMPSVSPAALGAAEKTISIQDRVTREQKQTDALFAGYDEKIWNDPEAYSPANELALMKKQLASQGVTGEKLDRMIARCRVEIRDRDQLYQETRAKLVDQKTVELAKMDYQKGCDDLEKNPKLAVNGTLYPMTSKEILFCREQLKRLSGKGAVTSEVQQNARETLLRKMGENPKLSYDEAKLIFVKAGGTMTTESGDFIKQALKNPVGDLALKEAAKELGLVDGDGKPLIPWGFRQALLANNDLNEVQSLSQEKIKQAMSRYVLRMQKDGGRTWYTLWIGRETIDTKKNWEEYDAAFSEEQAKACYYAIRDSLDQAYGASWQKNNRAARLFMTNWDNLDRKQQVEFVRDFCHGKLE